MIQFSPFKRWHGRSYHVTSTTQRQPQDTNHNTKNHETNHCSINLNFEFPFDSFPKYNPHWKFVFYHRDTVSNYLNSNNWPVKPRTCHYNNIKTLSIKIFNSLMVQASKSHLAMRRRSVIIYSKDGVTRCERYALQPTTLQSLIKSKLLALSISRIVSPNLYESLLLPTN